MLNNFLLQIQNAETQGYNFLFPFVYAFSSKLQLFENLDFFIYPLIFVPSILTFLIPSNAMFLIHILHLELVLFPWNSYSLHLFEDFSLKSRLSFNRCTIIANRIAW